MKLRKVVNDWQDKDAMVLLRAAASSNTSFKRSANGRPHMAIRMTLRAFPIRPQDKSDDDRFLVR